jgi:hypothetical protein
MIIAATGDLNESPNWKWTKTVAPKISESMSQYRNGIIRWSILIIQIPTPLFDQPLSRFNDSLGSNQISRKDGALKLCPQTEYLRRPPRLDILTIARLTIKS